MPSQPNLSFVSAIILAAGRGTRMKSDLPKVLHTIDRKPIIAHTLATIKKLHLGQILIVVGYKREQVIDAVGQKWEFVFQEKALGTGHAVKIALPHLKSQNQTVIVLNGDDSAFYKAKTIKGILKQHLLSQKMMTIVTSVQKNVDISGRVIRDDQGKMIDIKANNQLTPKELRTNNELVCGFYLFHRDWLEKELPKVKAVSNGEYPLTALITMALAQGVVQDIKLKNPNEWKSINTQRELTKARRIWAKKEATNEK